MEKYANETHLDFYLRWGRLARPYFQWQFEQFKGVFGNRIADIGCGLGNFTEFFYGKELYLGFEPDLDCANKLKEIHKNNNILLSDIGDICNPKAVEILEHNRIDTVICFNVLEHIENDTDALKNMVDGVIPGGHICLILPAFSWLYGTLDKLDGHYRRYDKNEITRLIGKLDVEIKNYHYFNLLGALGWFVKGRILKEKHHTDANFNLINKILPVISTVERFLKPCFGLSIILVLKKRGRHKLTLAQQ